MDIEKQILFFSLERLQSYKDTSEHYANFLLILVRSNLST